MSKKIFLLDIDYIQENSQTKARIFGVDEKGDNIEFLIDFDPYFYVLPVSGKEKQVQKQIERLLLKENQLIKEIELVKRRLNGLNRSFLKHAVHCQSKNTTY